ncbi:hypothetical protein S245_066500, partial [Arachis hypogaea]
VANLKISILIREQVHRKFCNSQVNHSLMTDLSCVFLPHSVSSRSLMRPNAAKAFVKSDGVVLIDIASSMLCHIEGTILQGSVQFATSISFSDKCQHDNPGFYHSHFSLSLRSLGVFLNANEMIYLYTIDVVASLRCSQYSLRIMASSRGLAAGRLTFQEPGKEVVDCSVCKSFGHSILGDLN